MTQKQVIWSNDLAYSKEQAASTYFVEKKTNLGAKKGLNANIDKESTKSKKYSRQSRSTTLDGVFQQSLNSIKSK